jgi:hypothetical protein
MDKTIVKEAQEEIDKKFGELVERMRSFGCKTVQDKVPNVLKNTFSVGFRDGVFFAMDNILKPMQPLLDALKKLENTGDTNG